MSSYKSPAPRPDKMTRGERREASCWKLCPELRHFSHLSIPIPCDWYLSFSSRNINDTYLETLHVLICWEVCRWTEITLWKAWNQNIETMNSTNIMQYAYIGIEYRYWTILNIWYYDKHLQTVQISIRIPIRLPRFGSRQLVKLPPWLDKKAANFATVGHDFTLATSPHLREILWEDGLNWFDSIFDMMALHSRSAAQHFLL